MIRRIIITAAVLCLAAPLLGGCAVEHLHDQMGKSFNGIMRKQVTVRLTDLDAPKKMNAEDGKLVVKNKEQDRKRSTMGGGGGRVLPLSR